MNTCPVCGYDRLQYPPDDHNICPSCGTQFGYTDAGVSHDELFSEWLLGGAHWQSRVIQPPPDWNRYEQIKNRLKAREAAIGIVELGTHTTEVDLPIGRFRIDARDYGVGPVIPALPGRLEFTHS
jgi:hypothetical protein